MSILTQIILLEKYGPRVNLEKLAEILETSAPNLRRKLSDKTFEIPTYVDGGKRWADTRDVALYLDEKRAEARRAMGLSMPDTATT